MNCIFVFWGMLKAYVRFGDGDVATVTGVVTMRSALDADDFYTQPRGRRGGRSIRPSAQTLINYADLQVLPITDTNLFEYP